MGVTPSSARTIHCFRQSLQSPSGQLSGVEVLEPTITITLILNDITTNIITSLYFHAPFLPPLGLPLASQRCG